MAKKSIEASTIILPNIKLPNWSKRATRCETKCVVILSHLFIILVTIENWIRPRTATCCSSSVLWSWRPWLLFVRLDRLRKLFSFVLFEFGSNFQYSWFLLGMAPGLFIYQSSARSKNHARNGKCNLPIEKIRTPAERRDQVELALLWLLDIRVYFPISTLSRCD